MLSLQVLCNWNMYYLHTFICLQYQYTLKEETSNPSSHYFCFKTDYLTLKKLQFLIIVVKE